MSTNRVNGAIERASKLAKNSTKGGLLHLNRREGMEKQGLLPWTVSILSRTTYQRSVAIVTRRGRLINGTQEKVKKSVLKGVKLTI